jgi:hypothetical protein
MRRWLLVLALVVAAGCTEDKKALFDEADPGPCIGAPHEGPSTGWLSDDGALPDVDGQVAVRSEGLEALTSLLPKGATVTRAEELDRSPACTLQRVVEATLGDGTLFVEQRQLVDTGTLFNVPLSGRQARDQFGSRGELVTDDFNGDGNRITALVITDSGAWTLVVARGANTPNLAGWPTTMPPPEVAPAPRPAPLDLDAVVALAQEISASTSTRPSR